MKMTIRDLLSSYSNTMPAHLKIYDSEKRCLLLKICFEPGDEFEWVYEDGNEELDKIADYQIEKWYVLGEYITICIDAEFRGC